MLAQAADLGLDVLRGLHVLGVAGLCGLVWACGRRIGTGPVLASCTTAAFAAMAAYRLVQLRPHLLTIAGALLLFHALVARRDAPSRLRLALVVAGMALWANLHAGFVLGPAMLAGCAAACALASFVPGADAAPLRRRALVLAGTAAAGLLATGLAPSGFARHLSLLRGAGGTPALARVVDEWGRLDPFALPPDALPPSLLTWGLFWGLALATPWACLRALKRRPDPVTVSLAALAIGSLLAMLHAVRFTWMGVFPLLLLAWALPAPAATRARGAGPAAACAALLVAFLTLGSFPMVSQGLRGSGLLERYASAYAPGKYFAHAVWFLDDAGLEGRMWNEYAVGGFAGYWLAPEVATFVNGTLNFPAEVMEDFAKIREGGGPGASVAALLDRYEVDLFLGVGWPAAPRGGRPAVYSTALLEGVPGWLPVFRNQTSAVYLRRHERNRDNLERVAAFYARHGVPFDREEGFRPDRAIEAALPWAIENGVAPARLRDLEAASRGGQPAEALAARDRLAELHAVLGLYEAAIRLDRSLLAAAPGSPGPRRRLVWSLLRTGAFAEAEAVARLLPGGPLENLLAATAAALSADPDDPLARSVLGRLPVLDGGGRADTMAPALRTRRAPAG